ncbi:TPA: aldo/keto reductase [Listeria monocytogenes]|nr:aldo/keto reductase [Listeria monocytogenes]
MKKIVLNNGVEMPILGFGVFQIKDEKECEQCVYDALMAGYRLIDTAASYGNEEAVGKAIIRSGIAREEIFITSKLWVQDYRHDTAIEAFERALKRLQTDYIDLYLLHQPFSDVYGAWHALEELYEKGKIRAIGVSNFQPDRLMDLMLHNKVKPAVNQIETNPFYQQKENQQFLKENNIQLEAWSPFGTGRNNMFENEVLAKIAKKNGKSIAQIILRWLIQNDIVVIPKSSNKNRIIENIDVFNFELDDEDINEIKALDTNTSVYFSHRDPETVKSLGTMKFDT